MLAKEELWTEIPNQYQEISILVRTNFCSQSLSLRVINLSPKSDWLVSYKYMRDDQYTILNSCLLLDY